MAPPRPTSQQSLQGVVVLVTGAHGFALTS